VPTYVYACRGCEDRTEVVQKMSDAPLTTCTSCGGSLRRVLFPPAVVYKGSGFYTTDYKNGGRKSESDTSTSTDTAAKPDTKSETKAETKAEAKTETKASS
jgi:putative FmdB family regulatory protein